MLRSTLILSVLGLLTASSFAASAPVRVLYLYGDVSADGKIPSDPDEPFHQMRLSDPGERGMSQFRAALEEVGLTLEERYDADVRLTRDFLSGYQGLILGSNQRRFSKEEAAAVREWVQGGGGLIAWSDSAFGGHFAKVGLDNPKGRESDNDLTAQFGMFFLTDNGGGNYRIERYTRPHFLNAEKPEGGIRYRGEGVSPIRVSSPAEMLAPLQEGGLGGGLKVNQVDAPFNPQTDAALAIAEVGRGRVVGTFDRNTFWNAGEGTRLAHDDNREFAQRLVLWAVRREDLISGTANNTQEGKPSPSRWKVDAGPDRTTPIGQWVELSGKLTQQGAVQPEIQWKLVEGPGAVEFENNNAAALINRARFNTPGSYRLRLHTESGGVVVSDEMTVIVR